MMRFDRRQYLDPCIFVALRVVVMYLNWKTGWVFQCLLAVVSAGRSYHSAARGKLV